MYWRKESDNYNKLHSNLSSDKFNFEILLCVKMRGQITSNVWVISTLNFWNWRAPFADKIVVTDKSRDLYEFSGQPVILPSVIRDTTKSFLYSQLSCMLDPQTSKFLNDKPKQFLPYKIYVWETNFWREKVYHKREVVILASCHEI